MTTKSKPGPGEASDLQEFSARTLADYDRQALSFWEGTRDHDVSQNYDAFLGAIATSAPYRILDFGCGPGRDLAHFRRLGHMAVGLDGSSKFVAMAREHSGCEVLHQNFLSLSLPRAAYDGVFANASLFHVPRQELPRILRELFDAIVPGGVLFSSNPRGVDSEGFSGERYGVFHSLEAYSAYVTEAGFAPIHHYYRPAGKPRHEQPWLASVWRRPKEQ